MGFLKSLVEMFLTKKKIIAYVSALIIAAVAAFLGMSAKEVKEAIVEGPVIEAPELMPAPAGPAQLVAPPPPAVPEKK